ncbi:PaaI family thioesterase [Rhodalgimonas zhirmunskyi]|uniref:PaaI family thioesterase n=1 Tax=Rhodalgimonas zhirmunskyi TaxID=2964767 RepID=A0AAJ1X5K2_9RHOB|nr:PaaI family thioesterase [Rhodoalgimonas zhirmunskyi]MDQ2093684.1 PaaI family thioesterase [Rhodoalgimonas zhirmunskyi]
MKDRRIAKSPEDLPKLDEVLSMSGLELMQAMARGEMAGPPIAETLGYTIKSIDDGRAVFAGTPEFKTLNPLGTVHGGWYGTLLDSCMACAVQTKVPQGSTYTTLEYKINIIRPIKLGTPIEAIGTAHHVGRSTGIATGEIRGTEDGKLYATGSTTCIIMKIG